MVENNDYISVLLAEFTRRNPGKNVVIDYAEGVAAETDYPVEIHIEKKQDAVCQIIIDIDTPYSDILMFVAEGLASIEAGFDANDTELGVSADHYTSLLASALRS